MNISLPTFLKTAIFRKGSFAANAFTMMSGTALSQVLVVAITPILTRLYSPQEFGVFALFLTISSILLLLASWRYETAIMLPKDHEDAANIFALSVIILLVMSVLALTIVLLFRQSIAILLKTPEMAYWCLWIPVNFFLLGLSQIFNSWLSRMINFSLLATARVIGAMAYAGIQIGIGLWGRYGPLGLVVGLLVANFIYTGILGFQIMRNDVKFLACSISKKNIIHQAFIYYQYPIIESWSVIAWTFSQKIPILFLNYFFNNIIVGLYFFGYRAINLPLQLINASILQVFYQRYEEKKKKFGKKAFLKNVLKYLAIVACLPMVILFIFSPILFRIIFGSEWEVAGEYVRILTPLLFFRFLAGPTTSVLWSEGKNFVRLVWVIMLMLTSMLAFYIGGISGNIYTALIIFSISQSILYLIHTIIVLQVASS